MKIYITIAEDSDISDWNWPDRYRIPVAGEVVLFGSAAYVVERVQWEMDQGSADAVQLFLRGAVPDA